MTGKEILDLPLEENDAGAKTVRNYLKALLWELWNEGESFSGKRPFGNSSWEYDLTDPLERLGMSPKEAQKAVFRAIDSL